MTDLTLIQSPPGTGTGTGAIEGGQQGQIEEGAGVYPDSYKIRSRIGRNGRLVLDKIPVYYDPIDGSGDGSGCDRWSKPVRVMYGTVLRTGVGGKVPGVAATNGAAPSVSSGIIQPVTLPIPRTSFIPLRTQ